MTNHALSAWGAVAPFGTVIAGGQLATRLGRRFPMAHTTAGANTLIRPMAVPFNHTVDQWGVAFPAGLVGVTRRLALPNPIVGTLEEGFQADYDDPHLSEPTKQLIAVPGVLPVGYSPNLYDGWHSTEPDLTRNRTASGYDYIAWLPSVVPQGDASSATFTGGGGGPINYALYGNGGTTGYRKVQFRLITATASVAAGFSVALTISHNADGTDPGFAIGDTVDWTGNVTDADFINPIGGGSMGTDFIDAGPALASLGALTTFRMQSDATAGATWPGLLLVTHLSPRMDVPYPMSVHGHGDLIAPGGLL